jgi:hypothetical protein
LFNATFFFALFWLSVRISAHLPRELFRFVLLFPPFSGFSAYVFSTAVENTNGSDANIFQ